MPDSVEAFFKEGYLSGASTKPLFFPYGKVRMAATNLLPRPVGVDLGLRACVCRDCRLRGNLRKTRGWQNMYRPSSQPGVDGLVTLHNHWQCKMLLDAAPSRDPEAVPHSRSGFDEIPPCLG